MSEETTRTPTALRQMAQRWQRLAAGLTDARTIDALTKYVRELFEEAEQQEKTMARSKPKTKVGRKAKVAKVADEYKRGALHSARRKGRV
jgi:hypothetical protein